MKFAFLLLLLYLMNPFCVHDYASFFFLQHGIVVVLNDDVCMIGAFAVLVIVANGVAGHTQEAALTEDDALA